MSRLRSLINRKSQLAFIFLVFFAQVALGQAIDWPNALRRMYEKYPSARMLTDPARLAETMKLVDKAAAANLERLIHEQPSVYDSARDRALRLAPRPSATKGTVVVSGVSGSGATAAKVFAEAGFQVEAYEARGTATREVQWGARQELSSAWRHYMGPEASAKFDTDIARPIGAEYKHMGPDYEIHGYPLGERTKPSSAALAGKMTGQHIISTSSVAAVSVIDVENLARSELAKDPNINLHLGQATPEISETSDGKFTVAGAKQTPKFVLMAEGAASKGSKAAGIDRVPASPARLQVAGVIYTDIPGGNAIGADFRLPGSDQTLVSGSLHRDGSGKVWYVTDLDPKAIEPDSSFKAGSAEYNAEKARLVEKHYRQIASTVLKIPPAQMDKLKITGAMGGALQPFNIQLGMSETAVKGNMILSGDNVGNGHWASGAGGMVAMTAHADALANYLNDLERNVDPKVAANGLNERLQTDTKAWMRAGIPKFWPDLPPEKVQTAFDQALKAYESGKAPSIQAALEEEVRRIPTTATARAAVQSQTTNSAKASTNAEKIAGGNAAAEVKPGFMPRMAGRLNGVSLLTAVAVGLRDSGELDALKKGTCPSANVPMSDQFIRTVLLETGVSKEMLLANCDEKQREKLVKRMNEVSKQDLDNSVSSKVGNGSYCRVNDDGTSYVEVIAAGGVSNFVFFGTDGKMNALEVRPQNTPNMNQTHFLRYDIAESNPDKKVFYSAMDYQTKAVERSKMVSAKESYISFMTRYNCSVSKCNNADFRTSVKETVESRFSFDTGDPDPDSYHPFGKMDADYLKRAGKALVTLRSGLAGLPPEKSDFNGVCEALRGKVKSWDKDRLASFMKDASKRATRPEQTAPVPNGVK